MSFIKGSDRQQAHLLPATVEEYVGADNPVRFLDAFVDRLDWRAAGFVQPKENLQGQGRPAYAPGDLLKLWLYGYLYNVRSTRRLELECGRNLEVIWLGRQLKPDFKTLADFRKDNAAAFQAVLKEFTRLCRQLDLFGGQLLAIDGTKIKASNAQDQNWSQRKLEQQEKRITARVEEYLQAVETADTQSGPWPKGMSAEELREKIAGLKERQDQIQARLKTLEASGQSQYSATDPDSRGMKSAAGYLVGYNVQGCVDARHHLLVTVAATNACTDHDQLAAVAQAAKAELEITHADVVADGGYYTSQEIKDCQDLGLEPHVAAVQNSPSERAGLFGKHDFHYEAARDLYRCPAGVELTRRREVLDKGRKLFNYEQPAACAGCAFKARCTQAGHRTVSRWEHEERLERMAKAVAAAPEKLAARKTLIEHCWGTLKHLLPGGFLVRGLVKVQAEVSLAHFSYNLKRALKMVGLARLLAQLAQVTSSTAQPAAA
jgi:transposase